MSKDKLYTLIYVLKDDVVLLGMKKRGFGVGRWNGFGGKVMDGEDIAAGAKRELQEESCVTATTLEKVGVITFEFVDNPVLMKVHVFKTSDFTGVPTETEEMRPQWYKLDEIPYKAMWPDDELWMPAVLKEGKHIEAYFKFEGMNTILEHQITLTSPNEE